MKTFKKKVLVSALAGASVLGLAGTAQAVNVNPDGLGQVLIYPYYTVRDAKDGAEFNSLLSVVNSTASGKAVKVRFLEGKNSKEVLDFNLFLSPHDVWTTAVVPTAEGGASLKISDTSCTVPNNLNGQIFLPYEYQKDPVGANPTTYDRAQEGYVEIIEMGAITAATALDTAVTHVATQVNGETVNVPANCGAPELVSGTGLDVPSGGLFGSMTLVTPKGGLDVAYDPVALDDFSSSTIFFGSSTIDPNLGHADPTSVVTNGKLTYVTDWSARGLREGAAAVSAVLMQDSIYNEYVTGGIADSTTEWVVTMPTKNLFFDTDFKVQELFENDFTANGSCDEMGTVANGREEETAPTQVLPSPLPPGAQADQLCWEANVISFGNPVFGSKNAYALKSRYANGWAALQFTPKTKTYPVDPLVTLVPAATATHTLVAPDAAATMLLDAAAGTAAATATPATYVGLPVVGFAVQVFNNGNFSTTESGATVSANYAGRLNHKFSRNITP